MTLGDQVRVLRQGVGMSRNETATSVRFPGLALSPGPLRRLLPCDLSLTAHGARQTLILDDEGRPLADATLLRDADDLVLLVDGMRPDELQDLCSDLQLPAISQASSHSLLCVDGPFAWELLAAYDRPGVIAMPYLTSFPPEPGVLCVRLGRCGEYGYEFLCPSERIQAIEERLLELGDPVELTSVSRAARDYCALENFVFTPRREGRSGLNAVELQLQWRLSRRDDYIGAAAVARARQAPVRRVTAIRIEGTVDARAPVLNGEEPIGSVIAAERCLSSPGSIALASLDIAWAHSGVSSYAVQAPDTRLRARTVSPPFVANLSLRVDPQRDSYRGWFAKGQPAQK